MNTSLGEDSPDSNFRRVTTQCISGMPFSPSRRAYSARFFKDAGGTRSSMGSLGVPEAATATRRLSLHALPLPPAPVPKTLCGQEAHALDWGVAAAASGRTPSLEKQSGLALAAPSS